MQHEQRVPLPAGRAETTSAEHDRRPAAENARQEAAPAPAPQQLAQELRSL